jgi:hypothetical protein
MLASRRCQIALVINLTREDLLMPTRRAAFLATLVVLIAVTSFAAVDTETITINATVADRAKLTILPTTINFPDADPDLVDPIPATENSVSVEAKVRTSSASTATLTCLADGDLISAGDVIDITNVSWTSTGAGYIDGTMDDAVDQSVGSWMGSGTYSGTFDYFLANSWDYDSGNYTQTVVYTLTAP